MPDYEPSCLTADCCHESKRPLGVLPGGAFAFLPHSSLYALAFLRGHRCDLVSAVRAARLGPGCHGWVADLAGRPFLARRTTPDESQLAVEWSGLGLDRRAGESISQVSVTFDFQNVMLLTVDSQSGRRRWVWVQGTVSPRLWLPLRRALTAHGRPLAAPGPKGS